MIINKKGGKQKKGSFLSKMSDICSENFFEVDLMKPPVELRTKIVYPNKEMKQNKFDDLIQKQPTLQEKDEMIEENWIEKEIYESDLSYRDLKIYHEERRIQVHQQLVKTNSFLVFAEFA